MSNSSSVVKQNFIHRLARDYSPLVLIMVAVFIAIFVIGAATAPNFLTVLNIKTILRDAAIVGIMAIGLTFVTLSGNFFLLSMKETAALSIIAFAARRRNGRRRPRSRRPSRCSTRTRSGRRGSCRRSPGCWAMVRPTRPPPS